MPFVSKMVELDKQFYLDGGITDSIPLARCLNDGYDKVIVVLTRPANYRKKAMNPLLAKIFYRKYPKLVEAICRRHTMYNAQMEHVERLEQQGKIAVIRPTKHIHIGRIEKNPDTLQTMYDLGVNDATQLLPRLKDYLRA